MIGNGSDPRLETPRWEAEGSPETDRRIRALRLITLPLAVWYFSWLLNPDRVGHPVLYTVLLACELFNVVQAIGFWWTCSRARTHHHVAADSLDVEVDVLIPTCGEPLHIVEPTIAAASAMRGARVNVHVLDDGPSEDVEAAAARHGANYVRRADRRGAKAGSLNNALRWWTTAPFVVVLDADHVPSPNFLERTLGHMSDQLVAFVQTPQYYANATQSDVAKGAWGQQALFFGPIARGKSGLGATFCCGTNVLFRRAALDAAGGFPEDSLTEDFMLSVRLHELGWRTIYVPEVLARGLGPEDMAAYVGQQHRWARGCLSAVPRVLRSRLPWRFRVQYLLSSMFFLTGWTFLVYMSLPVIRLLTGAQPVAAATADQFLLHFLPYFAAALGSVAAAGAGRYGFDAFALMAASFWVHVHASLRAAFRRPGRFVVTAKESMGARQPRAVAPTLVAVFVLCATAMYGLLSDRSPGTLNNVAFAGLHVCVLLTGAWPALQARRQPPAPVPVTPPRRELAPALALADPT